MDLILWRHADAEDGLVDMNRALTDKGRKQAEKMGFWLAQRLPKDARVLVSPAKRAQQTAAGLARAFETVKSIAPGADPAHLLAAAHWPDASGTVLLVGHQPGLGQLAGLLLWGEERDFSLKKGAILWLSNRTRQGEGQVVLKAALTPEMV